MEIKSAAMVPGTPYNHVSNGTDGRKVVRLIRLALKMIFVSPAPVRRWPMTRDPIPAYRKVSV